MALNDLTDLRKKVDKFTIRYAEGGTVKVATLRRESPKVSELAYYLHVMKEKHKKAFSIDNMSEYLKWLEDIKDELFLYFADENKWFTRKILDKMAPEDVMEIINGIVKIFADSAEEIAKEKKNDEEKPWECFEANIGSFLESTGRSLVEVRDWPYYVFQQEIGARAFPKTEKEYVDKRGQYAKTISRDELWF